MTDTILLTIPAGARFRGVATLVLGGIGSRLDLPYERMDELQLAILSALAAGEDEQLTIEVEADPTAVSVTVGPLVDGSGSDEALSRVLDRLVDSVEPARRDGKEWLTLRLARSASRLSAGE
jgi:hypothetical protein